MFGQQTIPTDTAPHVRIEAHGPLHVTGSDQPTVRAKVAHPGGPSLTQEGDHIRLHSSGPCTVHVPRDATLHLVEAHGPVYITAVHGALALDQVHGPLITRDTGPIQATEIHGPLVARDAHGDLIVEETRGPATIHGVQGHVRIAHVEGALNLQNVSGEITATVQGNAHLHLRPQDNQTCHISAKGTIHCAVPADASATIMATSSAHQVRINIPGASATMDTDGTHRVILGSGQSTIVLEANGPIMLAALGESDEEAPSSPMDATGQVSGQEDASAERQSASPLVQQLESQIGSLTRRLGIRISRRGRGEPSEEASKPAEPPSPAPDAPPAPTAPAAPGEEPSSLETEWQLILRMVAEKKITIEQADRLLAALEEGAVEHDGSITEEDN